MTGEGLHILTFAQYKWPLIREGFLAWHTYCDTAVVNCNYLAIFAEKSSCKQSSRNFL